MNDVFPSIDLGPYPMHDRDGFLEFALGLWFHTRHIAGKPTRDEIQRTLPPEFPKARLDQLFTILEKTGQLA
jgi:hypothetical protein